MNSGAWHMQGRHTELFLSLSLNNFRIEISYWLDKIETVDSDAEWRQWIATSEIRINTLPENGQPVNREKRRPQTKNERNLNGY